MLKICLFTVGSLSLLCLLVVSLLCLGLCVFGGGAFMGWGPFMQAGCLCVLVRVWVGSGAGAVGPVWALQ